MNLKTLFSILTLSIFIFGCGDDDDNDDPFAGVPSSEIVDVDLRDVTLSGTASSSGGRILAVGQKWWKQKVSKVDLSGECGDNEDQEITDGYYYAFYSSGEYYAKIGKEGTATRVGSWQWVDSETKEAIFIQSVEFTLRGLNSDELIIASDQSQATCTAITWEQFNQPYTE
ncbi:hypothetical protein SAMN04488029_0368 [Reichenbachiella faecimaris]|uniref:Uncharacterized protein n=1 Tax=Reichenbachiella faecimaris TaxID=692418 RepID=A0A1W2G5T7_REIFA|nr:hypothetical protein [Reichenbachiella faecimaris]SMD32030.1 hypothetical protein SAMN04488029_0368 [Reichenbachiella faecimaris]